ncbi:neuralized, putative, partial [Ixodes scapularis]
GGNADGSIMALNSFHQRKGYLVTISNGNRTAQRIHPHQEFNNGIVMSAQPLRDHQLFEVRIDKKVATWSGSIEIGVTALDPCTLAFPSSATNLREGSWVMSGTGVLQDGQPLVEEYGADLDQLGEGDRVGVMRSSAGELQFFVNGRSQGVAARRLPPRVYAVVDLYGKCAQVSIVDGEAREHPSAEIRAEMAFLPPPPQFQTVFCLDFHLFPLRFIVPFFPRPCNGRLEESFDHPVCDSSSSVHRSRSVCNVAGENSPEHGRAGSLADNVGSESVVAPYVPSGSSEDPLRFHLRCGALVHLSNGNRTAERRKPADEFNNGVVMTHRALRDDEWFEIRIDELVNKWSGSIELGVTTHNPDTLDFPATMTNMRSGTIMMSGSGILTNGKGSRREYGNYNLDELHEGDRIGVVRKSNGNLHYYINGMDQGMASNSVPQVVYGVVDLYGMTVKVTLLDRSDPSLSLHHCGLHSQYRDLLYLRFADDTNDRETERLLFHPRCGGRALVTNGGRTARRPSALDGFNNAVVLTNRALRADELFEVVLEQQVSKWTGSIDIGVTMFPPHLLEFPTTMTNVRSGTWIMTGCGVMHNGTEVLVDYCRNLDTLQADRVGVKRTSDGSLHFFINGADQGVAARNVPARVYGVIDLYGQTAQASVVDHSGGPPRSGAPPELLSAVPSPSLGEGDQVAAEVRFSELHGRNARVLNNGLTAVRPNAHGEFNFAIVVSSQPLTDNELFEVVVDQMVDRWSGSIEAGVTAIRPEDLEFPSTMTDISHDTWMLSGSAIMRNGNTVRNGYKCDLDQLGVGSRVGMMRDSEGCLRYFVNGEDQGVACRNLPPRVWAVVDLYGQCAQVSIVPQHRIMPALPPPVKLGAFVNPLAVVVPAVNHQFNGCCGKNVVLRNGNKVACRTVGFNNALVFSAAPLELEELFEVQVEQVSNVWAGTLVLGLTTLAPEAGLPLPSSALCMPGHHSWLLVGSRVFLDGTLLRDNYGPSLHRLAAGERIGVQHCFDGTLHIHLNGEDLGPAASNLPKTLYAVLDLYGMLESVSLCSSSIVPATHSAATNYYDAAEVSTPPVVSDHPLSQCSPRKERVSLELHENHGRNVRLRGGNLVACRVAGYGHGLLVSSKPLPRGQLFRVRIDRLNSKWCSSLLVGVVGENPEKLHFPLSALGLRKLSWVVCGDSVYHNGVKVCGGGYGPNLDNLQQWHTVGVQVDLEGCLHMHVNGVDQGVAARDLPPVCYALVDLYGQCEQVPILLHEGEHSSNKRSNSMQQFEVYPPSLEHILYGILIHCHPVPSFFLVGLPCRLMVVAPTEGYFLPDLNVCYCETCHKIRGDEPYLKVGEPPRDYAVPFGWCHFPLRPQPRPDNNSVQQKWHMAFHGVPLGAVRKTLDRGELLPPGEHFGSKLLCPFLADKVALCQVSKPRGKAENFETRTVCLSPTLRYAGSSAFCPRHEFVDPKSGRRMHARAAFQVLVQPGSYTTHPASAAVTGAVAGRELVDVHFVASELEWRTKEIGATVLHALLVRLEAPS